MKWENVVKVLKKIFSLKPNVASRNNASWCTDTDGFLEHSPRWGSLCYEGPALQKVIPVNFGPPLYTREAGMQGKPILIPFLALPDAGQSPQTRFPNPG